MGMGTNLNRLTNAKPNSIMFGVNEFPSLTIVKPTGAALGYLGIGTKDPEEMAHIVGKVLIERTAEVASSLRFKHPNTRGIGPGDPPVVQEPNYWDIYSDIYGLKFNTTAGSGTGTQRMIIDKNGAVGIGVAAPKAKLHVDHNILAEGKITTLNSLVFAPDNSGYNYWEISQSGGGLKFSYDANRSLLDFLFIGSNGLIGVGKTNPSAQLDVNGSFQATSAIISRDITAGGALSAQSATIDRDITAGGALNAGSATIVGAITAGGALSAQSAKINGAITANNANINGKIKTKEVEVTLENWYDFVFEDDYNLLSLKEVKQYIKQNGRLPEIPSAKEVEENGINLGEMQGKLLQKIEELTLYILDLQNQIDELKTK